MKLPYEPRFEDQRLLTGAAHFVDDEAEAGQAYGVFVRSPHAFADIRAIDTIAARVQPGVIAVLTVRDMEREGVGNLTIPAPVPGGAGLVVPHRPALAGDCVRHVGEAVALVVADTEAAARDAAERVVVEYDEREAVTDLRRSADAEAPLLWREAPGNVALDWNGPGTDDANSRALDQIFADAAYVARITAINQRIVVAPLEPRAALAVYDALEDRYTLTCGSQSVFVLHNHLCRTLGVAADRLRVVSGDVGGAFGMRTAPYPEYPALLVAARLSRRPVRWIASRSETFLTDNQARDTVTEAMLALDAEGRFLGLGIDGMANMGAYLTSHAAFISTVNFTRCLPGMYHIPRLSVRIRCLFTNTVPTGPYRGAGRPEANYCLERLVDEAARITGIDRIELRRRNLITPAMSPTRRRSGRPTTAAISPRSSTLRWRAQTPLAFPPVVPARWPPASAVGSGSRAFWRSPAGSRARVPVSASPAAAGSSSQLAFSRAAKGMQRSIGGSSRSASAPRSSRSSWGWATARIPFPAPAPSHRVRRCRLAAR
jgi:aerobic carbon-monoxide dehydrogenase large subunit